MSKITGQGSTGTGTTIADSYDGHSAELDTLPRGNSTSDYPRDLIRVSRGHMSELPWVGGPAGRWPMAQRGMETAQEVGAVNAVCRNFRMRAHASGAARASPAAVPPNFSS